MKKFLLIVLLLITPLAMSSQSLSEYQWKNRIVVIFTEAKDSKEFKEQLEQFEGFQNNPKGFKERKLVLIHALPEKHRTVIPNESEWQDSKLYQKMKKSKEAFEVILIGLDGGVKLRQQEVLETKKLFDLIDSMPMRQAEIRRNN